MKKLTAGIFATILGLTAMGAADAAQVASTKYVQGAIDSLATVAKTGAYSDLTGTPSIPSIEGLATESYVDQAETDAISSAKSYTDSEIGEIGDVTVKEYVDAAKNAASYDDTALAARVGANETAIDTLNTEQDTQDAAIKALQDANYAPQATTYTKTEVDNKITASQYNDTALAGRVTANETAIGTLNTEQDTQDAAIKALQDANYAPQATTYTKTEVDNKITASQYNDTALAGRVTANETAIGTLNTEQDTQDAAIAAAQEDATQALAEVAAENQVNEAQQQVINALDVTYVKVSDVVDTYVAPTPTAE